MSEAARCLDDDVPFWTCEHTASYEARIFDPHCWICQLHKPDSMNTCVKDTPARSSLSVPVSSGYNAAAVLRHMPASCSLLNQQPSGQKMTSEKLPPARLEKYADTYIKSTYQHHLSNAYACSLYMLARLHSVASWTCFERETA